STSASLNRRWLGVRGDAAFGDLALAGVGFHPVDPDVRACIGADVGEAAHLPLSSMPAALVQMAAVLPDSQPFPIAELPLDAPLARLAALLEEAFEQLEQRIGGAGALAKAHDFLISYLNAVSRLR